MHTIAAAGTIRRPFLCAALTALGLLAFLMYTVTLAPGVYQGDSAELAAGAHVLGFVHATGYPLYLLLGKLFSLVPVGDVAYRLNLMSAFFAALTVALLARLLYRITGHLPAALLAAFAFACSFTFWQQATVAEVYTLNTFCLALLLNVAHGWRQAAPADRRSFLLLFGLLYGLALGNHVNLVFLVPAFAVFAFLGGLHLRRDRDALFWLLVLFACGLSIYLYLPLRALDNPPVINWLKTDTGAKVWTVVSGEQFRGRMFSLPPAQVAANALQGLLHLVAQFPLTGFLLGAAGLRALWQLDRGWFWLCATGSATIFLYTINYDITDAFVYYLPLYLLFTLPLAVALRDLWTRATPSLRAVLVAALLLPYLAVPHILKVTVDRSQFHIWPDYAAALESLPPRSAVIAYWPHYTVLRYAQLVEGRRPDVRLVENSSLADTRYLDDVRRHRHYGPLFFTLETALVGTRHHLQQEGFFHRVLPPQPVTPVGDTGTLVFHDLGNGLAVTLADTPVGTPRGFAALDLRWQRTAAPLADTQPHCTLELRVAGTFITSAKLFPVNAGFPADRWQPGAVYPQRRFLYIPETAPTAGSLKLLLATPGIPSVTLMQCTATRVLSRAF